MELLLIGLLTFSAIALVGVYAHATAVTRQGAIRTRLAGGISGSDAARGNVALRSTQSRVAIVDKLPLSKEARKSMARELELAGQPLRVNEYLALRLVCAIAMAICFALAIRFVGVPSFVPEIAALLGMLVGWMLPRWYTGKRREQRLIAVENQLPEALGAISKSLRAGTGLLQALGYAADETGPPLGPEFRATLRDLQLGGDAEAVFTRLSDRIGSPDLDIAVTAILIQRTAGGNLSEILTTVTNTIRERAKLQSEIRVLTSRQTLTGNLVAALPVLIGLAFVLLNPKMGDLLINTTAGRIAMAIGLGFEAIGIWLIRRLGKIEV